MLTTFYSGKNDHRWVSFISLKTIKPAEPLRSPGKGPFAPVFARDTLPRATYSFCWCKKKIRLFIIYTGVKATAAGAFSYLFVATLGTYTHKLVSIHVRVWKESARATESWDSRFFHCVFFKLPSSLPSSSIFFYLCILLFFNFWCVASLFRSYSLRLSCPAEKNLVFP